jgi:uncharacterized protein (TIGR03435 family)
MALVLDKSGKLGLKSNRIPATHLVPSRLYRGTPRRCGFPARCDAVALWPSDNPPGRFRLGARNVPIAMFSNRIGDYPTGIDRPVLDKTGLEGAYDFVMEFTPQFNGPLPPGTNFTPDPSGPTFQEALKEQLGLKLKSQPVRPRSLSSTMWSSLPRIDDDGQGTQKRVRVPRSLLVRR